MCPGAGARARDAPAVAAQLAGGDFAWPHAAATATSTTSTSSTTSTTSTTSTSTPTTATTPFPTWQAGLSELLLWISLQGDSDAQMARAVQVLRGQEYALRSLLPS